MIEQEDLAVKWALDLLQYYFSGNTFYLDTDHAPFQWMYIV